MMRSSRDSGTATPRDSFPRPAPVRETEGQRRTDGSPTRKAEIETIKTFEKDHFQVYRWHLVEHTGTHMDAPVHFAGHDGVCVCRE